MPTARQPCPAGIGVHVDSLLELPQSPGWRAEREYSSLLPPSGRWAHLSMPRDGPSSPIHWAQPKEGAGVGWLGWEKPTLQPLSTNPSYRAHAGRFPLTTAGVVDPFDVEPDALLQTLTVDGVWYLERALVHQPTQRAWREQVWYRLPGGG